MSKSKIDGIELLADNQLRFKNGRVVTPRNVVTRVEDNAIHFILNHGYEGSVSVEDYFKYALWAQRLTLDHPDPKVGIIAYDNGYEHKSLPAAIMQTTRGKKVHYKDGNHLNCCRENLVVKQESPSVKYFHHLWHPDKSNK